jgi:hypothetical protein
MRGRRSLGRLRRDHGLERMAPSVAIAGVDPRGDTDARKQRPVQIDLIELEAYRQALDDLDPIAGRILGAAGPRNPIRCPDSC